MPSSLASNGPKLNSIKVQLDTLRGWQYLNAPDFLVTRAFAAADLTGANSGFFIWIAPVASVLLGLDVLWTTAGTNTLRLKKVLAAATSAAGAAADANNVDISAAVDLTLSANVARNINPLTTTAQNRLAAGDKLAVASAAGTASLAGALVVVRLAFI